MDITVVIKWHQSLHCQSIGTLALDWYTLDLVNSEKLAKIEASDWSRGQNAGFSLVERSLRKLSRVVTLQTWTCANQAFFTSNGKGLVHLRPGSQMKQYYCQSNGGQLAFHWSSIGHLSKNESSAVSLRRKHWMRFSKDTISVSI